MKHGTRLRAPKGIQGLPHSAGIAALDVRVLWVARSKARIEGKTTRTITQQYHRFLNASIIVSLLFHRA
jgi:hypothetical protein